MIDSEKKIQWLQEQVRKNPEHGKTRAELVCALLHEGETDSAISVIKDSLTHLTRSYTLPEYFHAPVISELLKHGYPEPAELLVQDLVQHYDPDDDEVVRRYIRKARKGLQRKYNIMPGHIDLLEWWKAPLLLNEGEVDEWYVGTLMPHYDELHLILACLGPSGVEIHPMNLDLDAFQEAFEKPFDFTKVSEPLHIEFGIREDDSFVILIHPKRK